MTALESNPAFSPDGAPIAFSGQYDGNRDVYVVAAAGGVPTRLTWHPGRRRGPGLHARRPQGAVHVAAIGLHQPLHAALHRGARRRHARRAADSECAPAAHTPPTARRIAYNPLAPRFEQWKQYRGGTVSRLWLFDTATQDDREGAAAGDARQRRRCDVDWRRGVLPIGSQRRVQPVLAYDPDRNASEQLTTHQDFPILNAAAGGGKIVYEQAGYLHLFDPATSATRSITHRRAVRSARDAAALREGRATGSATPALSPTGARAVFEFRGEIVTRAGREGRRAQPDQHRRRARAVAGVVAGRHARRLLLRRVGRVRSCTSRRTTARARSRSIALGGAGFYSNLRWSPDSRKVAYTDNSQALLRARSRQPARQRRSPPTRSTAPSHDRSATAGRPTRAGWRTPSTRRRWR